MVRDLEKLSSLDQAVYQSMYTTFRFLGKVIAGLEVTGSEKVPREEGVILAANHRHWVDIFMLPFATDRQVSMIAKKDTRDTPIMGWLFEHCGTIFMGRGHDYKREEQRIIEARVLNGGVLGYFFEGTRADTTRHRQNPYTINLGEAQEGVALTAARTNAPTNPVAISGFDFLFRPGHQRTGRVNIGEPIEAPKKSSSSKEAFTEELVRRTTDLFNQSIEERGIVIPRLDTGQPLEDIGATDR